MQELGFKKSQVDDCLYILREEGIVVLLVLAHIDNMAVVGKELAHVEKYKADLMKHVDITDLRKLHYILGIQVKQDHTAQTITLNQTAYICSFLERFGMHNSHPVSMPLTVKDCLLVT